MAKALYRKYRPKTLGEVIGQEQVTGILSQALKDGKISHAYLFIGPRGTGKTSVARIFAHEINNFPYEIEDDYVDIIEIDGASNRGIDNIRELREKATIAPTKGKYKVYIIDEVHMLTREAFNALLKTLEEPPAHTIFVMATTDAHKVPVTITSRAQTYTFRLAEAETMFKFLRQVADNEKIKITDDALRIIVKRGGGSFRDSLSLLDQISTLSTDEISEGMVIKAMGLPADERIDQLLTDYQSGDVVKITTDLKEILSDGVKPETLSEEIITRIVEDPSAETLPLLAKLADIKPPFVEAKLLVALAKPEILARAATAAPKPIISKPAVNSEQKSIEKEPVIEPKTPIKSTADNFDQASFIKQVKILNGGVALPFTGVKFAVEGGTLKVMTKNKIFRNILEKDENKQILSEASGGLKVLVTEPPEPAKSAINDAVISKISDIMGGEVENEGGGNPF